MFSKIRRAGIKRLGGVGEGFADFTGTTGRLCGKREDIMNRKWEWRCYGKIDTLLFLASGESLANSATVLNG